MPKYKILQSRLKKANVRTVHNTDMQIFLKKETESTAIFPSPASPAHFREKITNLSTSFLSELTKVRFKQVSFRSFV